MARHLLWKMRKSSLRRLFLQFTSTTTSQASCASSISVSIDNVFDRNMWLLLSSHLLTLSSYFADGFRKVKLDLSSIENPWWEFQHPKFRRGMPQLLHEIKRVPHCGKILTKTLLIYGILYRRARYNDALSLLIFTLSLTFDLVVQTEKAVSVEADLLKISVAELRAKLNMVDKSIVGLTKLVSDFMRESASSSSSESSSASLLYDGDPLAAGKKRPLDHDSLDCNPRQYQRTELPAGCEGNNSRLLSIFFSWHSPQVIHS